MRSLSQFAVFSLAALFLSSMSRSAPPPFAAKYAVHVVNEVDPGTRAGASHPDVLAVSRVAASAAVTTTDRKDARLAVLQALEAAFPGAVESQWHTSYKFKHCPEEQPPFKFVCCDRHWATVTLSVPVQVKLVEDVRLSEGGLVEKTKSHEVLISSASDDSTLASGRLPSVLEVRDVLAGAGRLDSGRVTARVRNTLSEEYGALVKSNSHAPMYYRDLDVETGVWSVFRLQTTSFTVDLEDDVLVEVPMAEEVR